MAEHRSPWDDPNVREALKERSPDDIALIQCGRCHSYGYYNQGCHFCCSVCDWSISDHLLDCIIDDGGVITLDEYTEMLTTEEDIP